MKVAVFGPEHRVGAVVGDVVVDLALVAGTPVEIGAFIRSGRAGIDAASDALAGVDAADRTRTVDGRAVVAVLGETTLHPPLPVTGRLFMAMGNYPDHVANIWRRRDGRTVSSMAEMTAEIRSLGRAHFLKLRDNVVANGDDVPYPARTNALDFEAEVGVVLGTSVIDIDEADFSSCVWGVTMVNDWSIRDYENRVRDFAYTKNFDGSCSAGPWIVVDEVTDVQAVPFGTTVNGTVRQQGSTKDMAFSFAEMASYLSRDMTLRPGDLISAGTCAGTGADILDEELAGLPGQRRFLSIGDEVEVSSSVIGAITNRIAAKSSADGK